MPVTPTYPGVYIEEVPSGVRTLTGVATSITAFVGRALRGPVDPPLRTNSYADFERTFGGLWIESTMSYAVQHYFLNGGTDAIIVRIHNAAAAATASLTTLDLVADNVGAWGNQLEATVDLDTADPTNTEVFNLTIQEVDGTSVITTEEFRNVSVNPNSPRYVESILRNESKLVTVDDSTSIAAAATAEVDVAFANGGDGVELEAAQFDGNQGQRTGIYALEGADIFNILCLPPMTRTADIPANTWSLASQYCQQRRAMLIIDPPSSWNEPTDVITDSTAGAGVFGVRDENTILYYPRLMMPDPLQENNAEEFVPCGVMAGLFARTDAQRGIWKAPAGIEANLVGVSELSYKMTDAQNGQLNPVAVNCLRNFPVIGNVSWGARTLRGADAFGSEWKYIPVRRLALYIEESLYRGTQWVVFEPNDEPLWAQIRLNVGGFMQNLFRQGAFAGQAPDQAYFVRCSSETTTQDDINRGIVNILVGFAPLKPAEFVIIKLSQIARQD